MINTGMDCLKLADRKYRRRFPVEGIISTSTGNPADLCEEAVSRGSTPLTGELAETVASAWRNARRRRLIRFDGRLQLSFWEGIARENS